jgi:type IV secretory pathway VirB10-like protein
MSVTELPPPAAPTEAPKSSKPFYRRWWFIAVVIVVVLAIAGAAAGAGKDKDKDAAPSATTAAPVASSPNEAPAPSTAAPAPAPAPSTEAPTNNARISKDEFDRLTPGMTYAEAVAIIGGEGQMLSENSVAGYHTVMYQWEGTKAAGFGANANAIFQAKGGEPLVLVSKAQFGL